MKNEPVGIRLAEIMSQCYDVADKNPWLEEAEDFNRMMFFANKLAYELIHGHARPGETPSFKD